MLRHPPWEVPPPGAVPFLQQERATVIGNAGANVDQILAQFECPKQFAGIIRGLQYQINDVVVSSNCLFALRFNQSPTPRGTLAVFPKSASHDLIEYDPNITFFHIPPGSVVDVLFRILAGDINTYLAGTVYDGWLYPEEYRRHWEGGIARA